jgi:hypothetical protein
VFGTNVQTGGATTPGLCIIAMLWLAHQNMTVIPHPPYSPGLMPYDFSLFPKMKLKLNFDSTEVIQTELQDMVILTLNYFQQCF